MLNKAFLLSFWLLSFLHYCCFGQTTNGNYFYVKKNNQFVLSEKSRASNCLYKLNSLFIWEKDTVYRIIFEYENKKSEPIAKQKGKHNFYPLIAFLNKAGRIKLYYKKQTELKVIYNAYDNYRFSGKKSELAEFTNADMYGEEAYTIKLKVLINSWNAKYNPMADRLASVIVYDGDGRILLKNPKRKTAYNNNFPLAFSVPGTDSVYFAKVYLINVYKASVDLNVSVQTKYLNEYKLISSVSFDDGELNSYCDPGLRGGLEATTLPFVFRSNFAGDTTELYNQLTMIGLTKYNFRALGPSLQVEKSTEIGTKKIYQNKNNNGQVANGQLVLQKINFIDNCGLAEYCRECNDTLYPVAYRIANHCPVNIITSVKFSPQNWRYSFSLQNLHFFSVENNIRQWGVEPAWSNDQEYERIESIWNWQLMSPGVGYWLSNSEKFGIGYRAAPIDYYINGKKIN